MIRMMRIAAVFVAIAIAGTACGGQRGEGAGRHEHSVQDLLEGEDPTCVGREGKRIVVEMDENVYLPARIEAPAGSHITIHVVNAGSATHTFTIEELGCDTQQLTPDEKMNITFEVPHHPVEFHCTLHEDMHGELVPV